MDLLAYIALISLLTLVVVGGFDYFNYKKTVEHQALIRNILAWSVVIFDISAGLKIILILFDFYFNKKPW